MGNAPLAVPQDMKIPPWLVTGAKVCYLSRTSGQKSEVIVEMVNTAKCEVEVSSTADGGWRIIPFAAIASAQNPLFPPESLPAAPFQAASSIQPKEIGPAAESNEDEAVEADSPAAEASSPSR